MLTNAARLLPHVIDNKEYDSVNPLIHTQCRVTAANKGQPPMNTPNRLDALRKVLKQTVGKRIALARADMNYSQADLLAELKSYGLDRTQGSLSQIETGKRLPSVEMIYVVARFLGTSVDYLLGLTDNALSTQDSEEELSLNRQEGRIVQLMRLLPRDRQAQMVEFGEWLLSQSPQPDQQKKTAAWHAAVNIIERKYGEDMTRDVLAALATAFPDFARELQAFPATEKKTVQKG